MKKLTVLVLALALSALALAAPALAAKKKTVTEDWTATNPVPYPASFAGQGAGCQEGQDALTRTSHAFTAPGNGLLEVTLDNFQGDWDVFVYAGDAIIGQSDAGQVISGAPPGEKIIGLKLKKGQAIDILACNWLGGPTADAHLVYTYK